MPYLNWDTKMTTDLSPEHIERMYADGYFLTRIEKGLMNKVRGFRIDLAAFTATSENRRVLRKGEHLSLSVEPLPWSGYSWKIGKLAKDFYEKFGDRVFSANKTKELLTDAEKSNFNKLLLFTDTRTQTPVGFVICIETPNIVHYSYPFYIEDPLESSRGLSMMTKAIEWAKAGGKKYIYLGSLQRPSDTYKLQVSGGEWFDGEKWRTDYEPLKEILK